MNQHDEKIFKVYRSIDNIVELLSEKKQKKISLGIRPSGQIHLGNMNTLLLASWLTYYAGSNTSELEITICDTDLPANSKGKIAVPFKYAKSPVEQYNNFAEYNTKKISDFMSLIQSELGIKYDIKKLSDIQQEELYREGLNVLIDNNENVKRILTGDLGENKKIPINPVCPKCHTVTRAFPLLLEENGRNKIIDAICKNDKCKMERYKFDLYDPEITISTHYLIDPIRDIVISPETDVHVFGGDYFENHMGQMSKIEKVKKITEIAGGKSPLYFVGPMFFGKDGEKISKSNISEITFNVLRDHFMKMNPREPWVRELLGFTKYLINEKVRQVDYSITRQHLLGGELTKGNLR